MSLQPIKIFFLSLLALPGCPDRTADTSTNAAPVKPALVSGENNDFNDYWFSGVAELNAYRLQQNRYGETREGEAVLIFVTEPFSLSEQVKIDEPRSTEEEDKVSVLKMNALRRFSTGIYDYSMMSSVFTPISWDKYPHTLKLTCSSQDWCGHSWTQLNRTDDGYRLRQMSYFQAEGDIETNLGEALTEDELFNRLRINPGQVETEKVNLIPGLFFARTAHQKLKPKQARISFKREKEASVRCVVEYLHLDRTLLIDFGSEFPHEIIGWEEIDNGQTTVKAVRNRALRSPYWQRNGNEYAYLRDSLGLRN